MKVLHLIPSVSPLRGGPSVVVHKLAAGLAAQGIEVTVVTTDDDGLGRRRSLSLEPSIRDGVLYRYFPRQLRPYTVSLPLSHWLWKHLPEYDLVHAHAVFSFPSDVGIWLAARRSVPYILRPLGILNRWGMEYRRPLVKRLAYRLFVRQLLEKAAAIHYTSTLERTEAEYLGFQAQSSAVIPNPVETEVDPARCRGLFRSLHPEFTDKALVLFLSRLDEKKGLDLLVPAFAKVVAARPETILVIAGSGTPAFEASIRNLAQAYGIVEHVHWAGFLSNEIKAAAFSDADVYVLPSYSENFGVAPVEAMTFGLPVIVSDRVGICADIEGAGAGDVVRCDPVEIAGAILRLLREPRLRAEMGVRGTNLARERFSKEAVIHQIIRLYDGILREVRHSQSIESGA